MKRYWVLILILLAAVVFFPDPGSSRAIAAAHDFAHAPVFGCVAVLLLASFSSWKTSSNWSIWTQYAMAIAGSAGLGLATEIAQAFADRDSSWLDLRSDVLGAVAFVAIAAIVDRRVGRLGLRIGLCTLGIAMMLVHSLPFSKTALAYIRRNQSFPVVFEARDATPDAFVGRMYSRFTYEPLPTEFASYPNEQALHVRFKTGPWLGMYLDEPYPNWTGYEALAVDITNASEKSLPIAIRVHDRHHDYRFSDRFNRTFKLAPQTRTTLLIPLADIEAGPVARKLDMQKIAQVVLFTTKQNASRDVYVSRMWLQ